MYLQKEENGAWFLKLATGFDSPDMIDKDDKKTKVFEDYIYKLFSEEDLLIQFVWKFDEVQKLNEALIFMDVITNENRDKFFDKMQEYGEFFVYLYKSDKSNREVITIEHGEDIDYPKTIDTSHINVNLFDFNIEDKKPKYFEWIKLNKEDFYWYYDSKGRNENIITTRIDFEKLLKHLEQSNNEVYNELFKKFNVKYFEEMYPARNDKMKKSKI